MNRKTIHNLYKTVKYILTTKHGEYLGISIDSYRYLKHIIGFLLLFNNLYKHNVFFRYLGKGNNITVIIALRYHGRNVRRRTYGHGKKLIMKSKTIQKCLYCTSDLWFRNISVDHIIPISLGGNNSRANLIINCCDKCNTERGVEDFYTFLYKKRPEYKTYKYPAV